MENHLPGSGDVSGKCFLCKCEDLNLDPQHPRQRPCVHSDAYHCMLLIPALEKWRQEEAWGLLVNQSSTFQVW